MHSFYNPGFQCLPPTPPPVKMDLDQPAYYLTGPSNFPPRYGQTGCEFIEQYSQAACFVKPTPMNPHSHSHPARPPPSGPQHPSNGRGPLAVHPTTQSQPQQQANEPQYGAGPILPPIRPSVQLPPMDSAIPPQYRRHQETALPQPEEQQRPKEEKPTGGVAAHLDYEMDQMADFVAEMAQGMYALYSTKINLADIDLARSVYPGQPVPPPFRKYVYQILSSTRLPSSTILLGLFYLATRMRMLSAKGIYATGTGQVYRMLTTALLLGSKFLDDNTFQNRSWSEVSNIPVSELNAMELEWLFAFDWKIHERIHSPQDGFATWLSHWENYRAKMTSRGMESRRKLAPIETNVQRPYSIPKPLMSPDGPIPPQYQRSNTYENSWLNPAASEYSPPSVPHSGPNTPDYYNVGPWLYSNPPPPYTRTWMPPQQSFVSQPRSRPPSYRHTPVYPSSNQPVWTGHGLSCGCLYCAKHQEYLCANNFGAMQPLVAG